MTNVNEIKLPNMETKLKVEWALSSITDNVKIVDLWIEDKLWETSWLPEKTLKFIMKTLIDEQMIIETELFRKYG